MLDFNSTPYFDDYDELKKFVRILFRPSKAVQTRELTQAQTILQNQVSRLGDYNFEEGSIVTGCETQLDLEYNYVKIVNPPPIDLITLIGFRDIRLFGNVSKVNARLVNYLPADVSDPETLYVKYFDSGEDSGENSTFFDNELITVTIFDFDGNQEGSSFSLSTQASDSTGVGSAISISEGVRYALGFFLLVEKQSLIIDKYGNQPTARLGFDVRESIITETDDPTLLDNALGSPNATAPGAHRYKIELVLSKTEDEDKENFIELVSLENGKILEDLTTAELASSGILVELAKRTYDANGDFIVEDFKSEIREHLNDGTNRGKFTEAQGGQEDLLVVDIDSGRAYVSGYEVKTTGQEAVVISKAREEAVGNNSTVFGDIGAYIRVDNLVYYPDIENYTQIELRNVATPIGYARVRSVDYRQADDEHRFYLFDIQMNSGELISNADNFVGTGAFASLAGDILDQDGVRLFERTNNVGIKTFPFNSVSNVTDITYDSHVTFVQKTAAGTPTSTVFWDVGSGERFVPFSARNYMLFNVSNNTYLTLQEDNPANPNYIQLTNNNTRVTISQLSPPTQDYVLIASVSKEVSPIAKQKTRQVVTSNPLIEESAPSEDERFILLKKPDIIELVSVVFDGADITDRYILDNGQRDGYYGLGRLLPVNPSTALAVGEQVEVTFSHYSHTGGDYFVVDSYPEEDYADIQNYVSTNGVEFDLRNAIDFRPTIGEDGTFTGSGSAKGDFWSNDTRIRADVSYYLSRIDKIAVDQTGNFFSITGTPDVIPKVPADSENGISLMELSVPAFTFSPEDVLIDYIERKRFTMDDIGSLEKRIENIEYYTALNLLEKDTADRKILNGLGDDRFKNGFIVDSFTGHGIGDAGSEDYKCSVDFAKGELRPTFDQDLVDLELDTNTNSVVVNDDIICLPYEEQVFIKQPYASSLESSNPNATIDWEGDIRLRPDHAKFYNRKFKPVLISSNKNGQFDTIVKGSNRKKDKSINTIWNFWQDHWAGRPKSVKRDTIYAVEDSTQQTSVLAAFGKTLNVPLVTTTFDNNKTFVAAVGAFLRPQEIDFKAKNMRPFTVVRAYFDGEFVGTYLTDKKGKVDGEFFIQDRKFRTGKRLFVLTDSTDPNDLTNATTYAEEIFYGRGFRKNRDINTLSIKEAKFRAKKLAQARKLKRSSQNQNASSKRVKFADPLAQTFKISEEGGCFLTSVDLWFGKKDSDVPVSIEIREVDDGVPTDKALPFSKVTLEPETDVFVSSDATDVTTFNFEVPVFVQEDTEYAIVITSNSANYDIFVSEVGREDLRTGASISKQPFSGYLLRSDKSFNWTQSRQRDVKFRVRKAVYDISATANIEFVNKDLDAIELGSNPIETTSLSQTVRVYHEDHGMFVTSNVVIEGASDCNGIPAIEINDVHAITAATNDWYEFDVASSAASTGLTGGNDATATRNIMADYIQPIVAQLRLPQTKTEWSFKGTTGGSHNDSTLSLYTQDADFTKIDIDETSGFRAPKIIASPYEEQNQSELGGEKSLRIKAELSSTNANLSPVIDLDRMGAIAVYSRINNTVEGETDATGGEAESKYVTKKISLNDPAEGIRVIFDANRPSQANIDIFYKILQPDSEESFESRPWVQILEDDYEQYAQPNSELEDFSEYEFKVDDVSFTQFAIKVVMRSSDSFNVPRIKNFRAIALGT